MLNRLKLTLFATEKLPSSTDVLYPAKSMDCCPAKIADKS